MEIKKVEKGTNTRDYDEEEEVCEKEETGKQEGLPQTIGRIVWIHKRVIGSIVAGGCFILVLVIAISISKHVGKNPYLNSEEKLCPPDSPVCPKGWFRSFHKCYHLSADQKTWNESQEICTSLGANLTMFRSLEEMYWFGLINDTGTSYWTWIDGTLPDSWLLIEGVGCARLSQRGISSDSCKSSRNYICSKEDKCG